MRSPERTPDAIARKLRTMEDGARGKSLWEVSSFREGQPRSV
jgi:hypothetical protein